MTPSELRACILDDHAELRRALADLEALSRHALDRGSAGREELRTAGEQFLFRLERHMRYEDEHLLPALRKIDAWGTERAKHVEDEHRVQRLQMRAYLSALRDVDTQVDELASLLLDLSAWLGRDMAEEEETTLHPDLLRDDPVGIDVETG